MGLYSQAILSQTFNFLLLACCCQEVSEPLAVNQVYTFVTAVPTSATYILVYSSFQYGLHARSFERGILKIARWVGLIHFSLSHITQPHTAQRVFNLRAPSRTSTP